LFSSARRNAPYSYDYNYSYTPEKPVVMPAADASPNGTVSAEQPAPTAKA
jgi:hypothetical protein